MRNEAARGPDDGGSSPEEREWGDLLPIEARAAASGVAVAPKWRVLSVPHPRLRSWDTCSRARRRSVAQCWGCAGNVLSSTAEGRLRSAARPGARSGPLRKNRNIRGPSSRGGACRSGRRRARGRGSARGGSRSGRVVLGSLSPRGLLARFSTRRYRVASDCARRQLGARERGSAARSFVCAETLRLAPQRESYSEEYGGSDFARAAARALAWGPPTPCGVGPSHAIEPTMA
jgi:hypothetical protein